MNNSIKPYIRRGVTMVCAAAFVASVSSCDKYLDELPDSRMELTSPSDVSNLLVSSYSEIHPAYLLEMYSDNSDEHINTSWYAYNIFQTEAYKWADITQGDEDYETPKSLWNAFYTGVATANEALQYINGLADQSQYASQKGEALVSRAYNMFMLANIFCMAWTPENESSDLGLPYPLVPETSVGVKYERGTLKQLYEMIDKDLQEGLPLVKNTYTQPKYHFTQTASKAFAARFYLYYRKYDLAIKYANDVLGTNAASNLRDWSAWSALSLNDQFQPNEYVSSKNRANILLQTVMSLSGFLEGPSVAGSRYSHGAHIDNYETLDSQGPWGDGSVMAYTVFSHDAMSKYILRKLPYAFEYYDITAGTGVPHCVISAFNYDETLMVRAEAYALKGEYQKAVDDLNSELSAIAPKATKLTLQNIVTFYDKLAYYTPTSPTAKKKFSTSQTIDATQQEQLLHCILHLRRIVTMHEGLRMQDVKRYGITIYRRQITGRDITAITDTMLPDDPRRAIQLPLDVIDAGLPGNPRK